MPSVPTDPQEAIAFFADILEKNGITNEIQEVKFSKVEGDGFRPDNQYVAIEFKGEEVKPLNLFIKALPVNSNLAARATQGRFFEKEAFFYNVFLVDAHKFCEKRMEDLPLAMASMFPKCYLATSDLIVLENLVSTGYTMTPYSVEHTFTQNQAVLEHLGQFQAVSYAMLQELGADEFKDKYPLLVEEIVLSAGTDRDAFSDYWENVLELAIKTLKAHSGVEAQGEIEFLEKYQDKLFEQLSNVVKYGSDDLLPVVNLGDLWNGNTMFNPDTAKKVYKGHVFVDMQQTRLGSPMLDISSYMFSSVRSHIHSLNWRYLLDVFYEFFRDTLEILEVGFELKLKDLTEAYKQKALYGLFSGIAYRLEVFVRQYHPNEGCLTTDNRNIILEHLTQENEEACKSIVSQITTAIKLYQKYEV